ncbi:MAG: DMT family transporter [Paludibacteraceae bacterium]|nr:DMT family transporter [Paludibacteraceae bacterium]
MTKNNPWLHYFLLLFGVLCISWSAIFVKLAGVSGVSSGFYRLLFGMLGIIPVWLYFRKPIHDKFGVMIAVICGVLFAADIVLWNTSIMLSKATISTLLANLAPVWVGLGALIFMKEKPRGTFWWGTALSLVGVVLIVGFDEIVHAKLNTGSLVSYCSKCFLWCLFANGAQREEYT